MRFIHVYVWGMDKMVAIAVPSSFSAVLERYYSEQAPFIVGPQDVSFIAQLPGAFVAARS